MSGVGSTEDWRGDRILTTGQVARLLGVSLRTVSTWADTGKLRCHRMPGSTPNSSIHRRYFLSDLIAFADQHQLPLARLAAAHLKDDIKNQSKDYYPKLSVSLVQMVSELRPFCFLVTPDDSFAAAIVAAIPDQSSSSPVEIRRLSSWLEAGVAIGSLPESNRLAGVAVDGYLGSSSEINRLIHLPQLINGHSRALVVLSEDATICSVAHRPRLEVWRRPIDPLRVAEWITGTATPTSSPDVARGKKRSKRQS